MSWPEPVQRVASVLEQAAAEARLEEFAGGTPTAVDAANAAGCKLAQIVKSLVFECDGRSILAMVPGDRRADPGKVGAAAGCSRAKIAGPERVREATGFDPGAVAPFPLPRITDVFVDLRLLTHERVWAGAGSPKHMVGLPPGELVRLTRARTADLSADARG